MYLPRIFLGTGAVKLISEKMMPFQALTKRMHISHGNIFDDLSAFNEDWYLKEQAVGTSG